MKGNVIALLEDPVQITDYLNAFGGKFTGRLIGVVGHDVHLKAQGALCNAASYVSAADEAQCLAVDGVLSYLNLPCRSRLPRSCG